MQEENIIFNKISCGKQIYTNNRIILLNRYFIRSILGPKPFTWGIFY